MTNNEGAMVVVRCDRSGVFYGRLVSEAGQRVVLADARHIWSWAGAKNTVDLAVSGTTMPGECRFTVPAAVTVLDAITILPMTAAAVASLDAVPVWAA